MRTVEFDLISTLLVAMVVLFLGRFLVAWVPVLRRLNIPAPVASSFWPGYVLAGMTRRTRSGAVTERAGGARPGSFDPSPVPGERATTVRATLTPAPQASAGKGGGHHMNRRIPWRELTLALAVILVSGCAGTSPPAAPLPPAKMLESSDLASLAGEWRGTLQGSAGAGGFPGRSANGRVTIAPDGSYTTNVSGALGVGKARIVGGQIVFEGSNTRGTATLYEGGGRRVLKGEGTWVGFDARSEFELTKQ
jgi:hypothetical protein